MENKSKYPQSSEMFKRALRLIPGGVNSPVRAFGAVEGEPFIVDKGEGAWLYDIDGNRYIDYVMSWGPLILGHAYPTVIEAIRKAATWGASFGAPTENELKLAEMVRKHMPHIEKIRMVSSGTEACMTAARIARGVTGRQLILKFDGGYHGHSDLFLVQAGSGLATENLPASAGVPKNISEFTLSIPYNNFEALDQCFEKYGNRIAGIIVEPIAANMGVIPPAPDFLTTLWEKASANGCLLILDEVITGFRVSSGGAAKLYNIEPDLVCLGKILGGGMPIGAVGGKEKYMDKLAPMGDIYQAGTLSGNPVSTAAGLATLKAISDVEIYSHLKEYADKLTGEMRKLFEEAGVAVQINQVESLFSVFFAEREVTDFESAKSADRDRYKKFFHHLLENDIYIAPSPFEAWFVSYAHREEHLEKTLEVVRSFLKNL